MKICFLGDIRSIHTKRWVTFFAKDHEVHLISLEYPEDEKTQDYEEEYLKKNVRIHKISKKLSQLLISPLYFKKIIIEINPDIVHAHYITHYGFCGAFSGFHPLILSGWGSDVLIDPHTSKIKNYMVKFAIKKADLITCDGKNSMNEIIKLGGNQDNVIQINHGLDINEFNPGKKDLNFVEGITKSKSPVVINIRGFKPIYNIECFISAIPIILKECPDTKFIISGMGYNEEKIKQLVSDFGISNSIHFVGWIPHDTLATYLASSDIYVSTSLSDGGASVSMLEAMACGLPVVVTEGGDNREWITDGKNGYIIPQNNPEILAEKVIQLLLKENLRVQFGDNSKRLIEENADYYKEMNKMENQYLIITSKGDI